ncbi:MAG: ferric reductase-like transmembrane domain-containing protein [Chloroflexi bacterium]|nr:ferric reductase-like transmembrane domain-containing protein [Chloroflexota bacterium]
MNKNKPAIPEYERPAGYTLPRVLLDGLAVFAIFALLMVGLLLILTPAGNWLANSLNWLFATDSKQLWWYVTRSAGILAYLLLWLSTVWGLAVPSKIIQPLLEQSYTFDFHQFISLLSIGFALLHIIVLTFDHYLPYSTLQILIPFLSPYRPLWVGIGVISLYIIILVTVTFYLRSRIGMSTFRAIHVLSLLGYLGITLHGFYAGTDSPLLSMQLLYRGTALVVIFLTVYWLVLKYQQKADAKKKAELARLPSKRITPSQQREKLR